jgi:hypothetical protein
LPDGRAVENPVESPLQKYFASPVGQIISTSSRHPTPPEGRIAIVTDAGCGCGGRGSVLRATGLQGEFLGTCERSPARGREMLQRTAKSRGPDAPTLVSSLRSCVGPTGLRQNISADDGGKRARSPRRARHKLLKPLRAGMPGDSGVLVVTRVRSTNTKCTRGRGCSGHPAFPTPSKGAKLPCTTRAQRAARSRSRIWTEVVSGLEFDVVAERKRPRLRHSGAMRSIEPGISRFPDAQLRI